mmetsp:Transcript_42143/g.51171  ORF Transcript_42143/g.51171 Transcript_42143/m.51171 type:complete len:176 (-) Transcript_42143:111-638(-)
MIYDDGTHEVLFYKDARRVARTKDVDLVQVGMEGEIPVVKCFDWNKHVVTQKRNAKQRKKEKEAMGVASTNKVEKEVRLSMRISEHDLQNKLSQIERFLLKAHRVKVTLTGKMTEDQGDGFFLIQHIIKQLEEVADAEPPKKQANNRIIVHVTPNKQAMKTYRESVQQAARKAAA